MKTFEEEMDDAKKTAREIATESGRPDSYPSYLCGVLIEKYRECHTNLATTKHKLANVQCNLNLLQGLQGEEDAISR